MNWLNWYKNTESWCEKNGTSHYASQIFLSTSTQKWACGDCWRHWKVQPKPCIIICYTNNETLERSSCCELPQLIQNHSILVGKIGTSSLNIPQPQLKKGLMWWLLETLKSNLNLASSFIILIGLHWNSLAAMNWLITYPKTLNLGVKSWAWSQAWIFFNLNSKMSLWLLLETLKSNLNLVSSYIIHKESLKWSSCCKLAQLI